MNRDTIRKVLGEFYGGEKPYHSPLPKELEDWHCYATDGGHCVLIVFPKDYRDQGDLTGCLCPAPVKSVVRAGYEAKRGYVVCDLPYSPQFGLVTEPGDDEF